MSAIPSEFEEHHVGAGLDVLALRTPTLPPATTTNTSFVGKHAAWVVDPATPYPDEQQRLLRAIDVLAPGDGSDGSERFVAGLVLTHHHPDHVGAARWLREQRGWPIHAHAKTAALLGEGFVDVILEEGDVLSGLGGAEDVSGEADQWHVLHTPGHASGHIVLWQPQRRWMIAGDMVAATGTIVVDPPDGHMATYIQQLRRLRALEPQRMVPAHGPVIEQACELLDFYVSHRLGREGKILKAVETAPWRGLQGITATAYADVPVALHGLASRAALAHLVKLEEDGAIERRGLSAVAPASLTVKAAGQPGVAWRSKNQGV